MSVDDRWKEVISKKLCINCLRKFHMANKCRFTNTCKACHRKHHTSLHRFYSNSEEPNVSNTVCYSNSNLDNANSENVPTVRENIQLSTTCLNSNSVDSNTLLSTTLLKVKNVEGNLITCRALIDNGSQKCLISKRCATLLELTETVSNKSISAINNTMIETNLNEVILEFKPHFNENKEFNCTALVVTKVTSDLPNFKFDSSYWPHLQGLKLADPTFFIASPIDILLGADMYAEMLLGQLISGKKGTPVAINSHLGWLVSGRIFSDAKHEKDVVNCHLVATLESQLKAFWELESIPQTEVRTKDDTVCERFYDSTVTRSSGRYTVRLPFNNFGNSASQALKRFNYLEAKLSKNNSLREQYSKFMLEYLQLGHMELVPPDEIDKEKSFYLPHHFVINEDSSTTKLRVVFDASAKDSNGNSLNSALFLGPRLQPELFSILLKFRYFKIAISGDIEKMYRQIRMNNEDSDFQRMFWRFNPDDDLQVYRLLTVTYGTACAPFLAVRTLKQLANDEEVSFPEASKVLQDEFYIDDLLSGADSIAEAKQLATDLNALLERGGFNLRKWASNCSEVFNNIPDHALACRDILIKETQSHKILVLFWNFKEYTFQVKISQPGEVLSKRNLLSVITKIYDPLGFLSPTTIVLKIMLQNLWKNKLPWDEPIPEEIDKTWKIFHSEMEQLRDIKIKRRFKKSSETV
ncbi:uncharacterized protein [Parasteatoda tepidariorum]|uniref:uncharacterized protein n=1 Tax=Parasteatoda tepidariorum TaxID=114398 RepID=UPI0039BD1729